MAANAGGIREKLAVAAAALFVCGMAYGKISGSEWVLVTPNGPYTTSLLGRQVMCNHSTTDQDSRKQKREKLKALVSRLGVEASPAQIREEAYRDGLGAINGNMLVHIRNELWPDRPKHAGGKPKGGRHSGYVVSAIIDTSLKCPSCNSHDTVVRSTGRNEDGSCWRQRRCRACEFRWHVNEASPQGRMHRRRMEAMAAVEKECGRCGKTLPVAEFPMKSGDAHLRRSYCRVCLNEYRAAHYLKSKLREFGMTKEAFDELLHKQNGGCAICGDKGIGADGSPRTPYRFLNIDHCHATGMVRGLLCDKCNLGIGNFNDDTQRLLAAVEYLNRHRAGAEQEGR